MPNFTLQKGEGCLDSVVEKAIMKMLKKKQRHTQWRSSMVCRPWISTILTPPILKIPV